MYPQVEASSAHGILFQHEKQAPQLRRVSHCFPTGGKRTARRGKKAAGKGILPSQHKKELRAVRIAKEANSFKAVALEWYETQTTNNTPAPPQTHIQYGKIPVPHLGKKAISSIEAQDLLAIAKPLESESA